MRHLNNIKIETYNKNGIGKPYPTILFVNYPIWTIKNYYISTLNNLQVFYFVTFT